MPDLTAFVCTYNSEATLKACLQSIRRCVPPPRIVVIDQHSSDSSVEIAQMMGAEIRLQDVGLGFARQLCFEIADTECLAFVDSDEEIVAGTFFKKATDLLKDPAVGAVAGMGLGHRFAYGLPMGLLVLRTRDFSGKVIPSSADAREEYFVKKRLVSLGLKTVFVSNAMIHHSRFRRYKPEWEGANTRIVGGVSARQLLFVFGVILLQSLNSRRGKNLVYVPIFYLKFLRGFANPKDWKRIRQVD